jgi:hypothetical protein
VGRVALTAAKARLQRLAHLIVAGRPDGEGLAVRKGQVDLKFLRMSVKIKPPRGAVGEDHFHFPLLGVVRSTYSPRL